MDAASLTPLRDSTAAPFLSSNGCTGAITRTSQWPSTTSPSCRSSGKEYEDIHRWGAYAEEDVPAGHDVIEYAGEIVGRNEMLRRSHREKVYFFTLDGHHFIDGGAGGSGAELINHCCDPNLVAQSRGKRLFYVSRRPIRAGEELIVDYKFRKSGRLIACRCGSVNCRGTINRV